MPRAPNDRPSRRLDAFLVALRRHGVREFEAAELEGVGKGLKFKLRPPEPAPRVNAPGRTGSERPTVIDPDLVPTNGVTAPIDELALVAEGRDGPVPADRGDA